MLFTAHGGAEESVIYPALADTHQKAHAEMAYNEQAMTKIQFALMEQLDPMSQEWLDKLEHIEGAVLHHVYQEEGTWFPELARDGAELSAMLTSRYTEEFERYMRGGSRARRVPARLWRVRRDPGHALRDGAISGRGALRSGAPHHISAATPRCPTRADRAGRRGTGWPSARPRPRGSRSRRSR